MSKVRMLTRKELYLIHLRTLELLEHSGVEVRYRPALKLLAEMGAEVDHKAMRVRLPRYLVEESLRKAPRTVLVRGRTRKREIRLERGRTYFGTLGTAPHVLDLDGRRRRATKEDAEKLARLADALRNVDVYHTMVMPNDVTIEVNDLHRWEATFKNITKPAMGGMVYRTENMPYFLRMCIAVAGGEDELMKGPPVIATECPVAPLVHDYRPTHNVMECAKVKIPVIIYSEPEAGASSPITMAGTLLITNAEVLSGITIVQATNPGAPVVYGSVATIMDMRAGNISFGAPETALLGIATTQLAEFYGLPNQCPSGRTDSVLPDAQAGYEKGRNAALMAIAGATINNGGGMLESNLRVSYEQLVIDDEIYGSIKRVLAGIEINEDTLAMEVIESIGPGGLFLSHKHTIRHLSEHYMPSIGNRFTYSSWISKSGGKDVRQRAKETAREILASHEPEPLDRDVERELSRIVKEAEKAHASSRLP